MIQRCHEHCLSLSSGWTCTHRFHVVSMTESQSQGIYFFVPPPSETCVLKRWKIEFQPHTDAVLINASVFTCTYVSIRTGAYSISAGCFSQGHPQFSTFLLRPIHIRKLLRGWLKRSLFSDSTFPVVTHHEFADSKSWAKTIKIYRSATESELTATRRWVAMTEQGGKVSCTFLTSWQSWVGRAFFKDTFLVMILSVAESA